MPNILNTLPTSAVAGLPAVSRLLGEGTAAAVPTGAAAGLPAVSGLVGGLPLPTVAPGSLPNVGGLTSGLPLVGGGGAGSSPWAVSLSLEVWLVTFQSSVVELALPLPVLLEACL